MGVRWPLASERQERRDYYAQRSAERRDFGGSYSVSPAQKGVGKPGNPLGGGISIGGREKGKPVQPSGRTQTVAQQSSLLGQYQKGQMVHHTAFGDGMIVAVTPMGGDALLEVAFDGIGTKKLMLKAAAQHMEKR